jgi:hypothetical protein
MMSRSVLTILAVTVAAGLIVHYLTKGKCACSEGNVT